MELKYLNNSVKENGTNGAEAEREVRGRKKRVFGYR